MIANPAVPHPFTLNDLRMRPSTVDEPSSNSALTLSGVVLALVLAIGAFLWLNPLRLFTPTEASRPAPAFVPPAEPARQIERQEIVAPLMPVPAPKSVEVPIARARMVQAPQVSAPVLRPRAAGIKPEARVRPMDTTNSTVPEAGPTEQTTPPVPSTKPEERSAPRLQSTKPEERTDAPIAPKPGDDTKAAPKPAAADNPSPATE